MFNKSKRSFVKKLFEYTSKISGKLKYINLSIGKSWDQIPYKVTVKKEGKKKKTNNIPAYNEIIKACSNKREGRGIKSVKITQN